MNGPVSVFLRRFVSVVSCGSEDASAITFVFHRDSRGSLRFEAVAADSAHVLVPYY